MAGTLVDFGGPGQPGGVPDPGSSDGLHFLCDNGHWSTVTGATGGTVTSVALTVPGEFVVAGSPITGAGTLAVTKAVQAAHSVWAGPTSGAPAAPTFRALTSADLPVFGGPGAPGIVPDSTGEAGNFLRADGTWDAVGTVTSVALAVPAEFSISGSPLTGAGTLTIGKVTQTAHYAWLGPTSGAPAVPAFRLIASSDLPAFAGPGFPGIVPDSTGNDGKFLKADGSWSSPDGSGGTVTNVSVTVPLELVVAVSNPTTNPHIVISKANEDANLAWMGPTSGTPAVPTFRAIVSGDLPVFTGPGAPGIVPDSTGATGMFLRGDGIWASPAGTYSGTVTSVALAAPGIFTVSGSPITVAGTLTLGLATETAHYAWLGPLSGAPAAPTFRAIDSSDLPVFAGPGSPGIVPDSTGESGNYLRADGTWSSPSTDILNLHVEDGSTTLANVATIVFTSGAVVTSGGTGIAHVAITNQGITATDGTTTIGSALKLTFGLATVSGSSSNVDVSPSVFGGASFPGVVPDPLSSTGKFLRDDGTWQSVSSTPSYVLIVTGGGGTVNPVGKINFTVGAVVTDLGAGEAGVAITNQGIEIVQGGFDQTGVTKLTVTGATLTGTAPNATMAIPVLSVSDGSTTVDPCTAIAFTSGGTVTNAGGGVAHVAITAPGITVIQGGDTQTNVGQLTFVGATLSGSSPDVTLTIPAPGTLTVTGAVGSVADVSTIAFGANTTVTDLGSGHAGVVIDFPGLEVTDGTNDQTGVAKVSFGLATVLGSAPNVSISPHTFGGPGAPGVVPDPVTSTGEFLRDDGTWQPITTGYPALSLAFDTMSADFDVTADGSWQTITTSGSGILLAAGTWIITAQAYLNWSAPTSTSPIPYYAIRIYNQTAGAYDRGAGHKDAGSDAGGTTLTVNTVVELTGTTRYVLQAAAGNGANGVFVAWQVETSGVHTTTLQAFRVA